MVFQSLIGYPNLRQLENLLGNPDPSANSYIASRVQVKGSSGISFGIDDLEKALGILQLVWNPLQFKEQADAVFGPKYEDFDKGLTEILALSTFQNDGTLSAIGFPPGSYTPPFEGEITDVTNTQSFVFDVKSASGSGIFLLRAKVCEVAETWAIANGYGKVDVNLFCDGPVPQALIGEYMRRRISQAYSTALASSTKFPPKDFVILLHGNNIRIQVRSASGVMLNLRAIHSGDAAGVFSKVIEQHVKKKARQAGKYSVPFLLVYCRPSTAGMSDLHPEDLPQATLAAFKALTSAGVTHLDYWLGCLYLDFTRPNGPIRTCHLLPGAAYPTGSNIVSIKQTVQCT